MGEMRESDWSRQILLRSDWSGPRVALYTTSGKTRTNLDLLSHSPFPALIDALPSP